MKRIHYKSNRYWAWREGYEKFVEANDEYLLAKYRVEGVRRSMEMYLNDIHRRMSIEFLRLGRVVTVEDVYKNLTDKQNKIVASFERQISELNKICIARKEMRSKYYKFVPKHMRENGHFRIEALKMGFKWEEP